MEPHKSFPHLIVPAGTQVVTGIDYKNKEGQVLIPKGSVGAITASTTDNFHSYRIRFPDGMEGNFSRQEFAIRKQFQQQGMEMRESAEYDFTRHIVYRCIVGSRAYGLDHEGSYTDRRGVYLPPAEIHWSLYGFPGQLENKDNEESYWEMQKFLMLALKANPNVLECLYSPLVFPKRVANYSCSIDKYKYSIDVHSREARFRIGFPHTYAKA